MSEDFDFNIDLNTVEDTGGSFEPMPEGVYELQAESFEQKVSKAGNTYISVQYRVTGENYNNRVVWENFTVTGANPTVAISRIKAWYIATGRGPDELNLTRESMAEMMGQGFLARIGIEKSEQYGDKNKIDSFLHSLLLRSGGYILVRYFCFIFKYICYFPKIIYLQNPIIYRF